MRFRLVDAAKKDFPVARLCKVLDVFKRHPELTPSRHEDLTPMLISCA